MIGSRKYPYPERVRAYVRTLDAEKTILVSGHGGAVDLAAEDEADLLGMEKDIYPADWNGPLGKGAGFARNTDVVINSDRVVAFWISPTPGTMDTIKKAKQRGLLVEIR